MFSEIKTDFFQGSVSPPKRLDTQLKKYRSNISQYCTTYPKLIKIAEGHLRIFPCQYFTIFTLL